MPVFKDGMSLVSTEYVSLVASVKDCKAKENRR